ncbi:hypothetical protein [Campylobacter sp. RM16187]|uniref:hypothetical protein n=1 Tax=Campylobacter sp. RM16187 TaxID=1660063 RepID=UPI0021B5736F|nr:hypothetical protein [Campylobacter sp. RM16187]QKG29744.1 hypothetical protein CDOMF_1508 [Campylobacter sp. RM16187]
MSRSISLLAAMGLVFDSPLLDDVEMPRRRSSLPHRANFRVKRTKGKRDLSQRIRANRRKSNLRSRRCR